jgi:hypothetical protein
MNLQKVIRKRLRERGLAADVHAVVSVNTGGPKKTSVTSRQTVVDRSGRK